MIFEGNGINQLGAAIRSLGFNEFDRYEIATVISVMPTLVKVDGLGFELDANDLIIAESLTERKQLVTLEDGTTQEMTFHSPLNPGDRVLVASMSGGQFHAVIDKAIML